MDKAPATALPNGKAREKAIVSASITGIIVNLLVSAVKVAIGLITSSIAIVSEGANSATDAATSFLAIVGAKLASHHPTAKHPFGFGRIEYLTGLAISALIVTTGFEFFTGSIKRIFTPEDISVSFLSLAIIVLSVLVKLLLGTHLIKVGKNNESDSLVAVGSECKADAFASVITIISILAYILFNVNLDGFAGLITSAIIIKSGVEVLINTLSEILGRKGKKELADKLYKEIRSHDFIYNAADMMLHNYGPSRYSGSVNIEIDHNKTVEEVYSAIHELQLHIMHEYGVTMVFGIYAVDRVSEKSLAMRKIIAEFVRNTPNVVSYHALFVSEKEKRIYCDLVVDYALLDWEGLRESFNKLIEDNYPEYTSELVIETEYV